MVVVSVCEHVGVCNDWRWVSSTIALHLTFQDRVSRWAGAHYRRWACRLECLKALPDAGTAPGLLPLRYWDLNSDPHPQQALDTWPREPSPSPWSPFKWRQFKWSPFKWRQLCMYCAQRTGESLECCNFVSLVLRSLQMPTPEQMTFSVEVLTVKHWP